MALTESQIEDCLTILGLPVRADVTFAYAGESNVLLLRDSEVCRKALESTNATQETKIASLLTQWASVVYDTDRINAQGLNSDPARTRARLARLLAQLIGWSPPSTMGGIRLGRG